MSLVIMDTFKGQDNNVLKELCEKNVCEVVIVRHNLTKKFQPLDLGQQSCEIFYFRKVQHIDG